MICYKCRQPNLENQPSHTVCDQIEQLENRLKERIKEAEEQIDYIHKVLNLTVEETG